MMDKPKLTPRTHEQLSNGGDASPFPQPQLMAAHEPLRGEKFVMPTPVPIPVQFPTVSLPPKAKRGRKPKEQKVNVLPVNPVEEPKPLKVALIGTAPSSRLLAPFHDPSWTIWGCSPGNMGVLPRCDAWVEVHGTNLLEPECKSYAENYIKWMRELKIPLYMQDQRIVPNAITIPKDQLMAEFGPYFFTSTFAWMMAMAIMMGAKEIALFGIDMASKDEYILQRPGAYYFFIEGHRRGVKMWAPYESDIFQPPMLYGYSDVSPFGRKLRARRDELKERVNGMKQQQAQLNQNITYLEGAIEDNDYMIAIMGGVQDNSDLNYLDTLLIKSQTNQQMITQASARLPSQG